MMDGPGTSDDDREDGGPDLSRPNVARIYDYMLGGSHNFVVDREFAARVQERLPGVTPTFVANRAFLRRAVRFCVRRGVRQFLDLGSGIPTMGNVHEVARALDPRARVAYVDHEPVAVAHGEQILSGLDGVSVSAADLRDVDAVLSAPGVRAVLDLDRPVAVLMVAVLHFVAPRDDPAGVLARYRAALAPGSMLAVSHASADLADPAAGAAMREMERLYRDNSSPLHLRDRAELAALTREFALVEPGIVELADWRPDPDEPDAQLVGGGLALVGHVPAHPASTS